MTKLQQAIEIIFENSIDGEKVPTKNILAIAKVKGISQATVYNAIKSLKSSGTISSKGIFGTEYTASQFLKELEEGSIPLNLNSCINRGISMGKLQGIVAYLSRYNLVTIKRTSAYGHMVFKV